MPVIGITGGSATGKSAFMRVLRERMPGATFFDADVAARELTNKNPEVRGEIIQTFGAEIYPSEGLNRAALRSIVFADPEKKRALEQILHPRIRRQWASEAESRRNPSTEFFLADIPLLYETGGESLCDQVVVVACTAHTQQERLMARSSLTSEAAAAMIAAQMPLPEKMARADYLIWNNGPQSELNAQAEIFAALCKRR